MKEKLEKLLSEAKEAIVQADGISALDAVRVKYLGKKGELTAILRGMGALSPEERPVMGALVNKAREEIDALLAEKAEELKVKALSAKLEKEKIDVTVPGEEFEAGAHHPLSEVRREMTDIFVSMGFDVVDGPEVELDYYNLSC